MIIFITVNTAPKKKMRFSTTYTQAKSGFGQKMCLSRDHLANVRVVISDAKLITDNGTAGVIDNADAFTPEVLSYSDPYPFGAPMPGRNFNSTSYRYGFNGKENDNEVSGNGNSVDFGERMYDPRLGRMRSIDRYADKYPYMSPYSYAGNNPIAAVDIAGDSLYVLFHVSGNGHGDDMFKAAALTRQYDIEHSGHFDPSRDKVVVLSVQNMSDIKAKPSKQ